PPNNVYGWGRIDILAAVSRIAHANAFSDGHRNRGCVSDANCNGNSDSHCNRCWDSDTNRNADIHGTTYSYSETCAIGTASAHTSAPAVAAKVSGHQCFTTGA